MGRCDICRKPTFSQLWSVWESVVEAEQKTYGQRQANAVLKQHQMPGHFRLTSFPAMVYTAAPLHPVKDPKLRRASQNQSAK